MKRNKWLIRSLGLLLALALMLPLAGPAAVLPAAAVTQQEIDALKDDASSLASQKKELQEQIKAVQADKSAALSQKKLIEQKISVIQAEN